MEMNVIENSDALVHVALAGRLDLAGVQKVELPFTTQIATRRKNTIVDIAQLDFIASLGMGMLLNVAKTLTRHRARLILVNPQEMVRVALKAARLTDVLEIASSLQEAKASLNGSQPEA
jgi:stage II sporulation protein AA (anti-sigma F factor antagonist)